MSTPIALWLAEKLEDPESAHGYRLVANNAADELRRLHQENEQLKAQADQSISCQCPACEKTSHASDCAVHNAPAYPVGECDCGAQPYPENFIDALKYDVARRDSESAQQQDADHEFKNFHRTMCERFGCGALAARYPRRLSHVVRVDRDVRPPVPDGAEILQPRPGLPGPGSEGWAAYENR